MFRRSTLINLIAVKTLLFEKALTPINYNVSEYYRSSWVIQEDIQITFKA